MSRSLSLRARHLKTNAPLFGHDAPDTGEARRLTHRVGITLRPRPSPPFSSETRASRGSDRAGERPRAGGAASSAIGEGVRWLPSEWLLEFPSTLGMLEKKREEGTKE